MLKINNAGESAEIMVYGEIGDDWGGITARQFAEALAGCKSAKALTVRVNSVGGNVDDAVAIHSLLRNSGKSVTTVVDGMALSSAATITMAGDNIVMAEASVLMIHNAWTICMGDSEKMRKEADVLEMLTNQVAGILSARSGQTVQWVRDKMSAETWMTAAEAKEWGFCTAIDANKTASRAAIHAGRFRNVPQWVKDMRCEEIPEVTWRRNLAARRLGLLDMT